MKFLRHKKIMIFVFPYIIFSGCTAPEKAFRPPIYDMSGFKTIMITPFENYTQNPAIAETVGDNFIETLIKARGRTFKILSGVKYISTESEIDLRTIDLKTRSGLDLIRKRLGVDGIISGKVTRYFEDVRVNPPVKKIYFDKARQRREIWWESNKITYVIVAASVTLINPEDGKILFTDSRVSKSEKNQFYRIDWSSDSPPPGYMIPLPDKTLIPELITEATRKLVNELSKNFVPYQE